VVAAGVGEGQDVADGGRDVVVRALHDPARTTADLVPRARLQAAAPERLVEDVVVAARSKLALQQRDARREVHGDAVHQELAEQQQRAGEEALLLGARRVLHHLLRLRERSGIESGVLRSAVAALVLVVVCSRVGHYR